MSKVKTKPAAGEARFGTFKGWTKPGPVPPGEAASGPPGSGESLDAISGHYRLFQLKDGHRFSTDDLLVAWYATTCAPRARNVLELGSGIGTVGMISAWRLPLARFVTIEAQDASVALARKSHAYNGLGDRYEIRHGDFRELRDHERFDLVLGSPPYFPEGSGPMGDHPQKVACRFELRGSIFDYCQAAAQHLAPGVVFACVFPVSPPHQHQRVIDAAREAGLVIPRMRPVALKEGEAPLLAVFLMMLRGDLPEGYPTWNEPELVIRRRDGSVHPEYSAAKLAIGFPP